MKTKYIFYKENNEDWSVSGFQVFDTLEGANKYLIKQLNAHIRECKSLFESRGKDEYNEWKQGLKSDVDMNRENNVWDDMGGKSFITKSAEYHPM